MTTLLKYMAENSSQIVSLLIEHIELTAVAVGIAILIGVPLGILISYVKQLSKPIVGVANVIQAVPSMAMLGLAIPLLGIGVLPAIFMVTLYSLLPIISWPSAMPSSLQETRRWKKTSKSLLRSR